MSPSDPKELAEEIGILLRSAGAGLTAKEIARRTKRLRREVNSVLYEYRGVVFERSTDARPKWMLLSQEAGSTRRPTDQLRLPSAATGPIHIDFQGGDWSIDIRAVGMSRNDPPVVVERTGPRKRIISVSTVYGIADVPAQSADGTVSSVAVVMAAAALVWEIAIQRGVVPDGEFEWESAFRDVMLSLAAHVHQTGDADWS